MTGKSVHRLEQADEILALHGQELGQRLAAVLLRRRARIMACMWRDAVFGEEHVLGAAQADALGAETACRLGIARDVGVGAHSEAPRNSSAHAMNLANSPDDGSGSLVRPGPRITSPVEPSSDSQSPSFRVSCCPRVMTAVLAARPP